MRIIHLQQEKGFAKVDDVDYESLSKSKWYSTGNGYAKRRTAKGGRARLESMHRVIMACSKELLVDHINGDGLDNQRDNLRICTKAQNTQHMKKHKNAQSGFKGVSENWYRSKKTVVWRVQICKDYKSYNPGSFRNIRHAAMVYDMLALDLHGEFAVTNFTPVLFGP